MTFSRDTKLGLQFGVPYFFGGFQFMARAKSNIQAPKDLEGATVCTAAGTSIEPMLVDFMAARKVKFQLVTYEKTEELQSAYFAERCDAVAGYGPSLAVTRALKVKDPSEHVLLPFALGVESQNAAIRENDKRFLNVVNWTILALIKAEALGIDSKNVDSKRAELVAKPDANLEAARLLGVKPGIGAPLGLPETWAYATIKAVGNYGEIPDRNIGSASPCKARPRLQSPLDERRPHLLPGLRLAHVAGREEPDGRLRRHIGLGAALRHRGAHCRLGGERCRPGRPSTCCRSRPTGRLASRSCRMRRRIPTGGRLASARSPASSSPRSAWSCRPAIGCAVAVLRLSANPLWAGYAAAYVQLFRNVPLILQALFWFALISHLPAPRRAMDIGGVAFLSNRGIFIPVPTGLGWLMLAAKHSLPRPLCVLQWRRRSIALGGRRCARSRHHRRSRRRADAGAGVDAGPARLQLPRRLADPKRAFGDRAGHLPVRRRLYRGDRPRGAS